jgi:outer membrane lipoprotein-sorting protein
MSLFQRVLGAALLLLFVPAIQARENPYDVLGKVLAPYTQVIAGSSKTKNRAITMQLQLEETGGGGPKLAGTRVDFAVEMPDRLRVNGPFAGERITVCRDGQKIWAYPGSRLQALLADRAVAKSLPEPDRKFKLAPFELPIPEKQLAFLPILFKVAEAPDEVIGGITCRVLDLQLMKGLDKSLGFKNASARIWVSPEYDLLRLAAHSEEGDVTVRFEQTRFAVSLPAATWQPTPEESADVLILTPTLYDQLVRGLMGRGRSNQ